MDRISSLSKVGKDLKIELDPSGISLLIPLDLVSPEALAESLGEPKLGSDGISLLWPQSNVDILPRDLTQFVPRLKNDLYISEIHQITLNEVEGLHPRYCELSDGGGEDLTYKTLSAPELPDQLIRDYLAINPIVIHRSKKHLYCIGNTASLRLAKSQLPSDSKVSVRYFLGTAGKELDRIVINELIAKSVVNRPVKKLYEWVFRVLRRYVSTQITDIPNSLAQVSLSKTSFVKWMGLPKNSLRDVSDD